MKKLMLMRHAKSSWDDPQLEDHERPLTPRGRKAAGRVAKYIGDAGLEPSIVLCTSALRARETLELLKPALAEGTAIKIEPKLYEAGSKDLLIRIRRLSPAAPSVLIIGHNPAMQELVLELASESSNAKSVRKKFPTAALAVLNARVKEWKQLRPGQASLEEFITPKGLRS